MIKLMLKIKYLLLISLVVLSVSCSAEDGADGADGIDGIDGIDGAQGPAGEDGSLGAISVVVEDFELVVGDNEISIPELTTEIANFGLVQGYIAGDEDDQWFSLPFSVLEEVLTDEGTTFTSTLILELFSIEPGKVVVFSLLEQTVDLRFVLVDGNISSIDINAIL